VAEIDEGGDGFDALIKTLGDFKRKEKIADAAISWRRYLREGKFDGNTERMYALAFMIDEYLKETDTLDEDPHTVGDTVPGLD